MDFTKIKIVFMVMLFSTIFSCSNYYYDTNKKTIRHNCEKADDICAQARKLKGQVESASYDYDNSNDEIDRANLVEKYNWLKEKCRIEQEKCMQ